MGNTQVGVGRTGLLDSESPLHVNRDVQFSKSQEQLPEKTLVALGSFVFSDCSCAAG